MWNKKLRADTLFSISNLAWKRRKNERNQHRKCLDFDEIKMTYRQRFLLKEALRTFSRRLQISRIWGVLLRAEVLRIWRQHTFAIFSEYIWYFVEDVLGAPGKLRLRTSDCGVFVQTPWFVVYSHTKKNRNSLPLMSTDSKFSCLSILNNWIKFYKNDV